MKADITRRTFKADKHYSRTIQQQGRVPMDSDWNEQLDIEAWRQGREGFDVIGHAGTPKNGNGPGSGFQLVALAGVTGDVRILPGRMWIDGMLCENDAAPLAVADFPQPSVILLPSLLLDERLLRAGDWVELTGDGVTAKVVQVQSVDAAQSTVTVAGGVDVKTPFSGKNPRLARAVTLGTQPDPPGTVLPLPSAGVYLAYLDVWQRHVTALDDPSIADVALGGPDTCTRARTVWQVRTKLLGELGGTYDCNSAPSDASTGRLRARAFVAGDEAPCLVKPGSSYTRLENQLYRVEVHAGGTVTGGVAGGATFKWSRENGSVVASWIDQPENNQLQIGAPNRDDNLGFIADGWVELIDDTRELSGTPGVLVRVAAVEGDRLTIDLTTAPGGAIDFNAFKGGNPRVRRWEINAAQTTGDAPIARDGTVDDGWLTLEDGVQVQFDDGVYVTGDYWLVPGRTIEGDVEWPRSQDPARTPLFESRVGVHHHYAPLAQIAFDPGKGLTVVSDCRLQFPPLTNIWASDVKFDNGNCDFDNKATTVQQALDALCAQRQNACCAHMITPDEQDLQGIIDKHIQDAIMKGFGGVHIAFADGSYTLGNTPLKLPNPTLQLDVSKADLTVSGCGFESKLLAPGLETALQFAGWRSVYVHDLSVTAGVAAPGAGGPVSEGPPPPDPFRHLGGALSFALCDDVRVERARLECASGSVRAATCITVNNHTSVQIEMRTNAHPATPSPSPTTRTGRAATTRTSRTGRSVLVAGRRIPNPALIRDLAGHLVNTDTPTTPTGDPGSNPSTNINPRLQMNASTNQAALAATPRRSVRVRGCDFVVGYLQTGVLVVDTHRVQIEDNRLRAAALSSDQIAAMTKDPRYLARLGRLMISNVYVDGKLPTENADPRTFGSVKVGQHTLHFHSDYSVTSTWLNMLSQPSFAKNELGVLAAEGPVATTPRGKRKRTIARPETAAGPAPVQPSDLIRVRNEVARRLKQVARAVLTQLANPQVTGPIEAKWVEQFRNWYNAHLQNFASVAGQGFVVGGTYGEEVRIRDNSIDDALEAIHVGFSHHDPFHHDQPDQGTRVQISGNGIRTTLPADQFGERHGIFVGNSDSVVVENNHVVVTRVGNPRRFEAIRLFGYYGKLVRIIGNHAESASASVRMTPLNLQDAEGSLWVVAENLSYAGTVGPTGVDVPAGVRQSLNIG